MKYPTIPQIPQLFHKNKYNISKKDIVFLVSQHFVGSLFNLSYTNTIFLDQAKECIT